MGPAILELTIMAAEELKNVTLFGGKMSPYAVAFVNPFVKRSTRTLRKGGMDPVWNDSMQIEVPDQLFYDPNSSLTIQVFNQSSLTTVLVGATRVMLQDIVRRKATKDTDEGDILTLQLWRPSGRHHGFVRVFLRLTGDCLNPMFADSGVPKEFLSYSSNAWEIPVPPPVHMSDSPVTGIPVSYAQSYPPSYGFTASSSSLPFPCHPASKPGHYSYPYPASYNHSAPTQRRNNSVFFGLLGGALVGVLLSSIF